MWCFNEPLSFHTVMSTNSRKPQLLQGASPWASPNLPPLVPARQCLGRGNTFSPKQRQNGGALPLTQLPPAQPPQTQHPPFAAPNPSSCETITQLRYTEHGFHKLQVLHMMSGCLNFTDSIQPVLFSFSSFLGCGLKRISFTLFLLPRPQRTLTEELGDRRGQQSCSGKPSTHYMDTKS